MIKKWQNRCLVCDHMWESTGYAEKCPECGGTDDIYSVEDDE